MLDRSPSLGGSMSMDLAPSELIGYGARLRQHYEDVDKRLRPPPPKRVIKIPQAKPPAPPKLPPSRNVVSLAISDPASFAALSPGIQSRRHPWAPRQIIAEVAEKHRISVNEIKSHRRAQHIVAARHEAFYRLCEETSLSLPQIGRRMGGFDHTTVLHGVRKHKRRIMGAA